MVLQGHLGEASPPRRQSAIWSPGPSAGLSHQHLSGSQPGCWDSGLSPFLLLFMLDLRSGASSLTIYNPVTLPETWGDDDGTHLS